MAAVLVACGAVLVVVGMWRGYVAARLSMAPFIHDDRTAANPGEQLPRGRQPRAVQTFVLRVALAIAWLGVAFYGLFLIASAR